MMKHDIDLMVTRLRGFWPSQAIALDTTKEAWAKSDVLQRLSVGGGKEILNKVKNHDQFPSLGQVEAIARVMLRDETPAACNRCNNTGWYYREEQRQYMPDSAEWVRKLEFVDVPKLDVNGNQTGTERCLVANHVNRCEDCHPGQ